MRALQTPLLAAALVCAATTAFPAAQPAKPASQPRIYFSDLSPMKAWRSGGDFTVYVQSKDDQWYRAELRDACMKYVAEGKGPRWITEVDDYSRKVSKVIVDKYICDVVSIAKSDPPP